jgi:proline iminopeptidase
MAALYPEIEPYDTGMLDVGDGHRIHWEVCGNPDGKPAVAFHGGPGSGCTPGWRRYFDPSAYRIILFDQRGAGRSRPHASEPGIDLATNTTAHLLGDIERLRTRLGVARWLVLGMSWGTTLALAYAERHSDRVSAMVLVSVATTTAPEVDWITRGVGAFFPEAWVRFRDGVPETERAGSLADAYHRLLMDPDPAIHEKAARNWCNWESAIVALHPAQKPDPRYERAAFRLGFARLVTHYWRHQAWLEDDALLQGAGRLVGIPGVLIHGRLDLGGPPITAWRLQRAWPGSELIIHGAAGHSDGEAEMRDSILAATDRFRALR